MDIYEVRQALGDDTFINELFAMLSYEDKQRIADYMVRMYDLDYDPDSEY